MAKLKKAPGPAPERILPDIRDRSTHRGRSATCPPDSPEAAIHRLCDPAIISPNNSLSCLDTIVNPAYSSSVIPGWAKAHRTPSGYDPGDFSFRGDSSSCFCDILVLRSH